MQGCKKFVRACHFQVMDPGRIDRLFLARRLAPNRVGINPLCVSTSVSPGGPFLQCVLERGEGRGTTDQIEAKGPAIIVFVSIMEPYIASNLLLLQLPILFAVAQFSIDRSIGGWASPSPSYSMLLSDRFHLSYLLFKKIFCA